MNICLYNGSHKCDVVLSVIAGAFWKNRIMYHYIRTFTVGLSALTLRLICFQNGSLTKV